MTWESVFDTRQEDFPFTFTPVLATCETLGCGVGFTHKANAADVDCVGYTCDVAIDKSTCCDGTYV